MVQEFPARPQAHGFTDMLWSSVFVTLVAKKYQFPRV